MWLPIPITNQNYLWSQDTTLIIEDNLPRLICLAQSLCLYRSTSCAISSSASGSPRTRFLSSSNRTRSTSFGANAVVPVHFLSRRPGPNGENRFGSRNPMGSTAGLFSEYEYLKSNGRSDFSGSLFVFELGTGGFCCVLGFWGFWRFGENGGSSSMYSEEEWICVKRSKFWFFPGIRFRVLRVLGSLANIWKNQFCLYQVLRPDQRRRWLMSPTRHESRSWVILVMHKYHISDDALYFSIFPSISPGSLFDILIRILLLHPN